MYHILSLYFYSPIDFTDMFPTLVGPADPSWSIRFFEIKRNLMLFTMIDRLYDENFILHYHWEKPILMYTLFPNLYYLNFKTNHIVDLIEFYNNTNAIRPVWDWLWEAPDFEAYKQFHKHDLEKYIVEAHSPYTHVLTARKDYPMSHPSSMLARQHYIFFKDFCKNFLWLEHQGAISIDFFNYTTSIKNFANFLMIVPIQQYFSDIFLVFSEISDTYNQYIVSNISIIDVYNTSQNWQNISFLIFILPLITLILLFILNNKNQLKQITFILSFFTFFLSLSLFLLNHLQLIPTLSNAFNFWYYFGFTSLQVSTFNFEPILSCHLSFDNFNLLFIILSTFLITITILLSWNLKLKYIKLYFILLTIINWLLIVTFSTQNIFIFFMSFESTLIPMFLLIFIWGSRERKLRAFYLLLYYTLASAILMLIALILIFLHLKTLNFYLIYNHINELPVSIQIFIFVAFFLTFASKIPMYPLHSWLPEAHVEAPTSGSVLLAGILLKIGVFALIKYILILFPTWTYYFSPIIISFAITSIILSSLTAIRQNDLKRIIAYSSIAHMNLIVIGIFIFSTESILGAIYQSISHGFVASALFILIGILYDRYHSRLIYYYSGLIRVLPLFSIFFIFFTLANIAFPGTSNFMGEMILIFGIGLKNYIIALLSSIGIILCGTYSLWLTNRICFGNISTQYISYFIDINKREYLILIIFSILTLVFGIYPQTNILNYQFIYEYIFYNLN